MTATTRSASRQTTPVASEELKNGASSKPDKQASPASTESSQDGDDSRERPVRRKLKRASIAGPGPASKHATILERKDATVEEEPVKNGGDDHASDANAKVGESRGRVQRKRSFDETGEDDAQGILARNASKHVRKRSRELSESTEDIKGLKEDPSIKIYETTDSSTTGLNDPKTTSSKAEVLGNSPETVQASTLDTAVPPVTSSLTYQEPSVSSPVTAPALSKTAEVSTSPGSKRTRAQVEKDDESAVEPKANGPAIVTNGPASAPADDIPELKTNKPVQDTSKSEDEKPTEVAKPKVASRPSA